MRKPTLTVSLLASMFLLASNSLATPSALELADWSVNAAHSLAKELPPRKEVEKLLGLSDTGTNGDSTLCSFTFVDLRRTDTLSMVAAFDSSGRGFCNNIEIVDRTASGLEDAILPTTERDQGSDVSKLIKDIAGDGRLELVVDMEIGVYQGGVQCELGWPVIFAWTGTRYADVSGQFKGFYRQRLQELTGQLTPSPTPTEQAGTIEILPSTGSGPVRRFIVRPPTAPPSDSVSSQESADEGDRDCVKAEAAKIERFLGISSDAGMLDAIKWSESDNPFTREFAINVFADIGTPEALKYLKTLAADPDPSVAVSAKASLRDVQRSPTTTYEVDSGPLE